MAARRVINVMAESASLKSAAKKDLIPPMTELEGEQAA
jgi:hypothetical protein